MEFVLIDIGLFIKMIEFFVKMCYTIFVENLFG